MNNSSSQSAENVWWISVCGNNSDDDAFLVNFSDICFLLLTSRKSFPSSYLYIFKHCVGGGGTAVRSQPKIVLVETGSAQ